MRSLPRWAVRPRRRRRRALGRVGGAGAEVGVEDGSGGRGGAGFGALDGAAGDVGGGGQSALGQQGGVSQGGELLGEAGVMAVGAGGGRTGHIRCLSDDLLKALGAPGPSVVVLPAVLRMFAPTHLD